MKAVRIATNDRVMQTQEISGRDRSLVTRYSLLVT